MVRKKYPCDKCGRLASSHGLVKMKGHGRLCHRCREGTEEYKTGLRLPFNHYLYAFFKIKNKNKGDLTK